MVNDIFENKIDHSEYKILIVDDVMSNVLLLKILLTNEKFQVLTAKDGFECIKKTQELHPDLILLDVMMPGISGFETAEKLREDQNTSDIPIFFLTALNTPSDLVKGFKVGASDFITKPFNKEELLVRVMHQISLVAAKRMIKEQNEALKNTIEGRDRMYSVIAHDLRSPMSTVKIVLNMLTMTLPADVIGQENFDLINQTNQQVEEVFSLLDNLLKWTKSQTGRLNVVFQDFDVDDVIPGIIEIFKMVAEVKHITLEGGAPIHLKVHADVDMVNTVVRNFLSNAIKFSEEGSKIELYVTQQDKFAKISVRDHGCGISEENQKKLFHSDTAYTTYGTNNEEGSGLGLLLCKDFALKNGGDVELESVVGEGSTFSVLIPLATSN